MEYRDPIGDIIKQADAEPKQKGKRLSAEYRSMDVYQQFQKTAREQGFLPEWVKLRKKVHAALLQAETDTDMDNVNFLIRLYNQKCPSQLQKGLVTLESKTWALSNWE
ncbi:hypothetical protein [Alkalicoccus luteus]|uniref:DUF1992 domain-containing protein n=1 Tax=Alkalicoccus luteus TaxID=1237094 RepID=A0A969PSS3_9BACI|nr:hypothetical protein [Alkalicoccus luteus]NJP38414.1 hypothetical protein [Alkalicoccus luteus]